MNREELIAMHDQLVADYTESEAPELLINIAAIEARLLATPRPETGRAVPSLGGRIPTWDEATRPDAQEQKDANAGI